MKIAILAFTALAAVASAVTVTVGPTIIARPAGCLRGVMSYCIPNSFKYQADTDTPHLELNAIDFEQVRLDDGDCAWTYDGKVISVAYPYPWKKDHVQQLVVSYTVRDPIAGLHFSHPNDTYPARGTYVVTHHETERCRYWLPCVDYPSVRTTLEFHITHSGHMTALANGTLVDTLVREDGSHEVTSVWKLDQPCPSYLICLAVGEFIHVQDETVDGVECGYYAEQSASEDMLKRAFHGMTPTLLKWFKHKLGMGVPWSKYYQIALPPIGSAMENISLVTWTDTVLLDEKLAMEVMEDHAIRVNVHEMAHSYFGNMVVSRHFEHTWLKEGWAKFMEITYLQDFATLDDAAYRLYTYGVVYADETRQYTRPIATRKYDSSWAVFDRHTYHGGCLRLNMLCHLLGKEDFWNGVRHYLRTFQLKVVETDDFRRCLEHESGLNLTRFFDQWIYGKGFPKIKGSLSHDEDKVVFVFEQTQKDDKAGIDYFDLDLEVEVVDINGNTVAGKATFINGRAYLQLHTTGALDHIRIDPYGKVFFQLDMDLDTNLLLSTAKHANVVTRIWAYKALVSKSRISEVKHLVLDEPMWGVRVQVATVCAAKKSRASLDLLATLLANEVDPLGLRMVVGACNVKDPIIRKAVLTFLQRDDLPYRAHAAALIALGRQGNTDDEDMLLRVASDDSQVGLHAIVRKGALTALGHLKTRNTFNFLLKAIVPGHQPEKALTDAVMACAVAARVQPDHVRQVAIEAIAQLLKESDYNVKRAAIHALCHLQATSTVAAMKASLVTIAHQFQPALLKAITTLNEKEPRHIKTLTDTASRLQQTFKEHGKTLWKLHQQAI